MVLNCPSLWLRKGSRGSLVVELQTNLKAHNYYPYKIDGDYGYYTQLGVKLFQKSVGYLLVDGIFGEMTCRAWKKKFPETQDVNKKTNIVYCTSVTQPSQREREKSGRWKHWDDLSNLTKSGLKATCTRTGTLIAGKNGTYNTPAPLTLHGFDFSGIPAGSTVEKVIVHYSQSKSTYCSFSGAKFSLVGLNKSLIGNKVTTQGIASNVTFTGVTLEDLNKSTFALTIEYPQNGYPNVGKLQLWNVFIEVICAPAEVKITPVVTPPQYQASITGNALPKIPLGQWTSVRFTLTKTGGDDYIPKCDITIPTELGLMGNPTDGILSQGSRANTYEWTGSFLNGEASSSFKVKALAVGEYNIEIHELSSDVRLKIPITVTEEEISVSSGLTTTLNRNVVQDKVNKYEIEVVSSNIDRKVLNLTIILPNSQEGSYNSTSFNNLSKLQSDYHAKVTYKEKEVQLDVQIPLHSKTNLPSMNSDKSLYFTTMIGKIPIEVIFKDRGYFTEQIYFGKVLKSSTQFVIKNSKHTQLAFVRLPVPSETIDLMADGINYTATSLLRYVPKGSKNIFITDYKRNLRFGIYNHSKEYIQIDRNGADYIQQRNDFLKNVQYGDICDNKLQAYSVNFEYHENNPLYYVWVYEYITSENYGELDVEFTDPMLVETKYNKGYEKYGLFLEPVDAVLSKTIDSRCDLDSLKLTNRMVFDQFEDGGVLSNPSFVCIGILVSFDYANNSQCEAQMTLYVDNENKGYRSVLIPEGAGTINIGGKYDLFGLTQKQLKNNMEDLEFQLMLSNPYQADSVPELNNMQVKFYYINLEQMGSGFTVNGVRNEYMGLFFEDFEMEAGTDNDVKYYKTSGTDKTVAYRSNIKSKKMELKCRVVGCTLDESEALLENIVKIFQNDRDKYNKPIEKTIWFDHAPDYEYKYVMEDPIKAEPSHGEYELKIKLVIPSGTAESRQWVITADTGANNGVAPVYPVIYLVAKQNNKIELTESVRGLSMLIESTEIQKGDQIVISHEPRTVMLVRYNSALNTDGTTSAEITKRVELTKYVDLSSTWFYLMGEYNFKSTTAIISKIMFKERW